MITDERCLEHAGFENYANSGKRVRHKENQPENAERLMILINKDKGVLSASDEFANNQALQLIRVARKTMLGDVFRVHDYNYMMKIIELCENKLKDTRNEYIQKYGKFGVSHC